MKVIYIAGPFRADTHWGIVMNVREAEHHALHVWRLGGMAFCPHLNTANFQGSLKDQVWLRGDLEMLRRCDAVWLLPDWKKSKGSRNEKKLAESLGIPCFENGREVKAFIEGGDGGA